MKKGKTKNNLWAKYKGNGKKVLSAGFLEKNQSGNIHKAN